MKETIYYLENRNGIYLYHFIVLYLGGLYYIDQNDFTTRSKVEKKIDKFAINNKNYVSKPTNVINYPIKIYFHTKTSFHKEAFEILKDKYELIDNLPKDNYEIVSIYGEVSDNGYSNNSKMVFPFIRNMFLSRVSYINKGKRIFITRNGSDRRVIMNENNLKSLLDKYNFEYIQLEKYSFKDKIKLFVESSVIISTHGSQLTFTLFVDTSCKVVEILNKGTKGFFNYHIENICKTLNISYNKYSNIKEDKMGNFNLNIDQFENYLLDNKII